jgi:tetratricopeptide (TPR) repeat protein
MSEAFQRGMLLFSQGRFELADRAFRQALAQDPDNAVSHACLALCLAQREEKDEALREADEAVRLAPTAPFCHYARAQILLNYKRLKEAEDAITEAIRLDPTDADYFDVLARIGMMRSMWQEALDAAEQGLALDAEHAGCTNMRAMALVNLGRREEAKQTLHSALANDPENPFTHANQGWALLHQGDHAKALEHFREALRLEPDNEWARVGIIEALKARYLIYRLMLRFFLWMSRQSEAARWGLFLGVIFLQQILAYASEKHWIFQVLIFVVFGFLMMTWVASPLFNLLLRFNKFGRLTLSREQRIESTWIGGCFILAGLSVLAMPLGYVLRSILLIALGFWGTLFFGFLLFPLAVTFRQPAGRPRVIMAVATAGIALFAVPFLSLILFQKASPFGEPERAREAFGIFRLGCILSTWVPAVLRSRVEYD